MIRPCNRCKRKNCAGSKAEDMRKPCPNYIPINHSLGVMLEELIETSPEALSELLLNMELDICNSPLPPYFVIKPYRCKK